MVQIRDGKVLKKCNFDIYKLYNYLRSRNFDYLTEILDYKDDIVTFKYEEDYSIDINQKGMDLIKLVGLLHSKSTYYKMISKDKYKELYDLIRNYLLYLDNYYNELFDEFINIEYMSPSKYLFLNNYYIINSSIKYCLDNIDNWYSNVSDANKERVVLVHNNLRLDHYIKNDNEYLISFDNYIIDSPIIDLYKFYNNEWNKLNFKDIFNEYNEYCNLNNDEVILLNVMISMPSKIDFIGREIDICSKLRYLIEYLKNGVNVIKE